MSCEQLSDADGKDILRKWPLATKALFGGSEDRPWLRAQPKSTDKHATTPWLAAAGSSALTTRPDGMWFRPVDNRNAVDVFCVEICGGLQNLQDKRSRYSSATYSRVVCVKPEWWNEEIYRNLSRWKKSGVYSEHLGGETMFPVRHLRVLFAVADKDYKIFSASGVASAHEFFIPHSSLSSFNSQKMQDFLYRMSPIHHFYIQA